MCRRGNSLFPRRRNGRSRLLNEGWVVFVFNTACQQAAGRMLDLLLRVDVLQSAVLTVMGALGKALHTLPHFLVPHLGVYVFFAAA